MSNDLNHNMQVILRRVIALERALERQNTFSGGRIAKSKPLTIAGDVIEVDRMYHVVSAESGVTDDITTISATTDGVTVVLRAETGHTITLIDGVNLALAGNFTMSGNNTISLIYDKALALWLELCRSVN